MVQISDNFWKITGFKQRMREKDWTEILLADEDSGIIGGRIRTFVAKKLGFGVVEIALQPLEEDLDTF